MSAYQEVLKRGRGIGVSRAPKAEAIALFCESNVQTLVGAVAPELVWLGAMARGLSFLEFGRLCAKPLEVEELQWIETVTITCERKRYRLVASKLPDQVFGPYDFGDAVAQVEMVMLPDRRLDARDAVLEAFEHGVAVREVGR